MADVTFHDAYLVESYRDENGQPRQRTISYLGNIRQIGDEFPGIERELFLLRAELILNNIPTLSDADRADTMKQLAEKVPPLDHNEVKLAFENNLRWYFRWWAENGGAPSREEVRRILENAAKVSDTIPLS